MRQSRTESGSAVVKVDLLAEGIRLTNRATKFLERYGKRRLRVRSGSCGGVDLVLPGRIYVNCPVDEEFAWRSRFELDAAADGLRLHGPDTDLAVEPVPEPAYYAETSSNGRPWRQVGQVCSDRLGIGLTNACVYWASEARRCHFCSIGLNVAAGNEIGRKVVSDIVAVTDLALKDPVLPARHVLLGGGTPPGPDAGAVAIAEAAAAIKAQYPDVVVYAMLAPPERLEFIDLLVDSGIDELGINVELFSARAARRFMPGKAALGLSYFLEVLGHAVTAFGRVGRPYPPGVGRVRSIAIVGLEPEEVTLDGVDVLCRAGVMPILTPFRPMRGTAMEFHPRWSGERLWRLTTAATEIADRYGMPLGPTCVPCQANTLNVPGHPAYQEYP